MPNRLPSIPSKQAEKFLGLSAKSGSVFGSEEQTRPKSSAWRKICAEGFSLKVIFFIYLLLAPHLTAASPSELGHLRSKIDAEMLSLLTKNPSEPFLTQAAQVGQQRAQINHQAASAMLLSLEKGDVLLTQSWRAEIDLPKYASAVEGAIALTRLGSNRSQIPQIKQLLAREYLVWQSSRIRQKTDDMLRYITRSDFSPLILSSRSHEIQELASFPQDIIRASALLPEQRGQPLELKSLNEFTQNPSEQTAQAFRNAILNALPNLLTADDLTRRQSLMGKLVKLVPKEYKGGVRAGEIVVPLEYREAVSFTQQATLIFAELAAAWRIEKADALKLHGAEVEELLASLDKSIRKKEDSSIITSQSEKLLGILQKEFGIGIRKAGKSGDVVAESALEVRSLLGQSMLAALDDHWREANALRLEAYTTFDLEIERRVLPRAPDLGRQVEKSFLEGYDGHKGIKAVLDGRGTSEEIQAAYQRTLDGLDECVAMLRVGLSPQTVSFNAFTIVTREGMEAVVVLAALLAGFRGPQHQRSRRGIFMGVILALVASIITFIIGNTIIRGLSRYGEVLEAVVSVFAVVLLLMVTNWVFHKVYWVEWNAKIRVLGNKAKATEQGGFWELFSMVGVGFLTIYREGFETTLFLQTLILEGGWDASLKGLAAGLLLITILGYIVFSFGAKLPYRKLLVITGVLVVSIMMTFIGSTVRLFQIVGWLPVHPIEGLQIPTWAGLWLGLYPTYEGLLIPLAGIAYVGGTWIYNKWNVQRQRVEQMRVQEAPSVTEVSHL
jgi:high-affinity iron transporter